MPVTRRTLLSAPLISAGLTMPLHAFAQGTPVATTEGEPLPPEVIFERLLESEITSPLFPSDATGLTVEEWVDPGDTDLEGAVGGVMVRAGTGDDAQPIGAYVVHPTFDSAERRFASNGSPETTLWSYELWWYSMEDMSTTEEDDSFAVIATRSGLVIVSAFAQGAGTPGNELRTLANLAGMLDHLHGVTSEAGPR